MKTYTYDYYTVDIPEDVFPLPLPDEGFSDGGIAYDEDELKAMEEENREKRASLAIDIARENARLYCIPCQWAVLSDNGNQVIVRRKRAK